MTKLGLFTITLNTAMICLAGIFVTVSSPVTIVKNECNGRIVWHKEKQPRIGEWYEQIKASGNRTTFNKAVN